jgi:hypothetical protein
MGLDMYLQGRKFYWGFQGERETEDGYEVSRKTLDLGYWRKHPNLHGYVVETFGGGVDECQDIELDADDLRDIVRAVKEKDLPHTEGFFFGASDGSDDEIAYDLETLTKAIEWLERQEPNVSKTVVYRASW